MRNLKALPSRDISREVTWWVSIHLSTFLTSLCVFFWGLPISRVTSLIEHWLPRTYPLPPPTLIIENIFSNSYYDDDGDFPGGSDGKESACNAGDLESVPRSRRSSGVGNGNPLQYSCP